MEEKKNKKVIIIEDLICIILYTQSYITLLFA